MEEHSVTSFVGRLSVCRPLLPLLLLLALTATGGVRSGGIDFDLNEPPPEEYVEQEAEEAAREETQLLVDEYSSGPTTTTVLACPGPFENRHQRDRHSAASLRERFQNVLESFRQQANQRAKELPDYCDYEKFKASQAAASPALNGGRSEEDPGEHMYRRSLYLKRCLDVFRSRVDFRLGKKTYLEGVTPLADLSPNEVGRLFMSAPPMEFAHVGGGQNGGDVQQYKAELRKQRLALKENDIELPSQSSLDGDEPATAKKLQEKLHNGQSFATDTRLVMDSGQVKTMIASLLDESVPTGQDSEEYRLALREELIGAELEHKSESCANFDDEGRLRPAYPQDRWPLTDLRPAGRASGRLPDHLREAPYEAPQLAAGAWKRQYLDWSHHKCFHKVYKQFANCGCCYAVAAVNMAEFVACTQDRESGTVKPRKFSEMHALNCALKYHPHNMGCSGGSVLETLRFLGQAGLYTRKDWRQQVREAAQRKEFTDTRDLNCPMRLEQPWHEWGKVKVELNPVLVHPNEWLEALEDGPLVATVQMPRDGIVTYSGGVHSGESCRDSNIWHVMLLVGYGIDEHGIAYWRFRNSFGPEWGDQGHFNLAMAVPGKCFAGGVRVYREPVQL